MSSARVTPNEIERILRRMLTNPLRPTYQTKALNVFIEKEKAKMAAIVNAERKANALRRAAAATVAEAHSARAGTRSNRSPAASGAAANSRRKTSRSPSPSARKVSSRNNTMRKHSPTVKNQITPPLKRGL